MKTDLFVRAPRIGALVGSLILSSLPNIGYTKQSVVSNTGKDLEKALAELVEIAVACGERIKREDDPSVEYCLSDTNGNPLFQFSDGTIFDKPNGRADGNDGFQFYRGGRREDGFSYRYLDNVRNVKN